MTHFWMLDVLGDAGGSKFYLLRGNRADFGVSASASSSLMESRNSLHLCRRLARRAGCKECKPSKSDLLAPAPPRHQKAKSVEGNVHISGKLGFG